MIQVNKFIDLNLVDECPTVSYLMRNILDYEKAPTKTHHSWLYKLFYKYIC